MEQSISNGPNSLIILHVEVEKKRSVRTFCISSTPVNRIKDTGINSRLFLPECQYLVYNPLRLKISITAMIGKPSAGILAYDYYT